MQNRRTWIQRTLAAIGLAGLLPTPKSGATGISPSDGSPKQMSNFGPLKGSAQEKFLASSADIAVLAGRCCGKSTGLLFDALRGVGDKDYIGILFKRTFHDITAPGGIWEQSEKIFPRLSGVVNSYAHLRWQFPSGATVHMSPCIEDDAWKSWMCARFQWLGIDECQQFSKENFYGLMACVRGTDKTRPCVRLTCTPGPCKWLTELLWWWIDWNTGLAVPERDGKERMLIHGRKSFWQNDDETKKEFAMRVLPELKIPAFTDFMVESLVKSVALVSAPPFENAKEIFDVLGVECNWQKGRTVS